jgi:hypothetical protein
MSAEAEELKEEIHDRILSHRPSNPFAPVIDYEENDLEGEIIVHYSVDLPEEQRRDYNRGYFDSDRYWVEQRGSEYDLTASLYCDWQR